MAKEDEQAKQAKRAARFRRRLEGPPRVRAVATPRAGIEHWREQVAETGLDVPVVEEKHVVWPEGPRKRARMIIYEKDAVEYAAEIAAAKPTPKEAPVEPGQEHKEALEDHATVREAAEGDAQGDTRAPLRVTVHRPELSRTVRIETGPEGTEIHLEG